MSLKLTKLYNSSQQILPHLKSFNKSLPKTCVILKAFLDAYTQMTKVLISLLKERQRLNEIYNKK